MDETRGRNEPVAIIGIACRFPGAADVDAFWRLLVSGDHAIRDVPRSRFDVEAVFDPTPGAPGKISSRRGAFLDDIDGFDAAFFGISPREATRMDPQQRLLLELAWEALEDAGQRPDRLRGSDTGVFVGMITNEYRDALYANPADIDIYSIAGCARSVAAGRLSYAFGLQGPSIEVDTACSSSLVAVHLACQSLRNDECRLAVAAGVNLILRPDETIGYSQAGMLAPDGLCKFGDARADGFVRSEGAGVVVLERLDRALDSGDPVHAVIRGSAVNNDGDTSGLLMTPSSRGQEQVVRAAYDAAGIRPGRVGYVEAHGTGTSVGDPVEISALGTVLAEGRPEGSACRLGSVKTNIGHAEAAAGIAGLIKAALCVKHRAIPPSLHFEAPNTAIPWHRFPVTVQRELTAWPTTSRPALAGVSSFGISGTNAHVVVEEAPAQQRAPDVVGPRLLAVSARSAAALEELARAYCSWLGPDGGGRSDSLADICRMAGARRTHHEHRLGVVGRSHDEIVARLEAFVGGDVEPGISTGRASAGGRRRIVFVFPGQGSQWLGMGRRLLTEEPVFRAALEEFDRAMRAHADWSLLDELASDDGRLARNEIDAVQPTLCAIQIGLASLWSRWGVNADAVVGHSMGEVAAAHVAGALALEDAVRVICRRSRLLRRASRAGAMASVELSLAEAASALAGHEDRVSIAAANGPTSTVLSGDRRALETVVEELRRRDVFCRFVNVDVASHSPQMDALRDALLGELNGVRPRPVSTPFYSTVTDTLAAGTELDAGYWARNLRETVLFSRALEHLIADGHDTFVELSPHPVLLAPIRQVLAESNREAAAIPSLRRDEDELAALLAALGTLYTLGAAVDWNGVNGGAGARCVRLPSYPWQRERFWFRDRPHAASRRATAANGAHPLLGSPVALSHPPGARVWELELDRNALPYLADHQVDSAVVLPGTAYVEMALAAGAAQLGSRQLVLREIDYRAALFLPTDAVRTVQIALSPAASGEATFHVYGRSEPDAGDAEPWVLHASGTLEDAPGPRRARSLALAETRAALPEEISGAAFYARHSSEGNEWGPMFRGIQRAWRRDGEALALVSVPAALGPELDRNEFHPAVLDACGQALAAAAPTSNGVAGGGGAFVLRRIERVRVDRRPGTRVWSHAVVRSAAPGAIVGDVRVFDEGGAFLAEMAGLRLQSLGRPARDLAAADVDEWLYELAWEPKPRAEPPPTSTDGTWLVLADEAGTGRELAALVEARGGVCVLVTRGGGFRRAGAAQFELDPGGPEQFRRLLNAVRTREPPLRAVVHLWSLDADADAEASVEALEEAQVLGCETALELVRTLGGLDWADRPRVSFVTRGVQRVAGDGGAASVAQAPIWGLGRVALEEHPELGCRLVDLDPTSFAGEAAELFSEISAADGENQIALRRGGRFVARLRPSGGASRARSPVRTASPTGGSPATGLVTTRPGTLESLALQPVERRSPGRGEVEVEVEAMGLNFRDVLVAMGVYPGLDGDVRLGWECAGTVSAVGPGVEGTSVGDEVVAIAHPAFRTHVTTPEALTVAKPASLTFEEAATIPIAFTTAYYALCRLARLREGERVLVHVAAGGVGLAAVQIAQTVGAEIFATAGSAEKRRFLASLGVRHVFDSRGLDFADEILDVTGGEGVDVVLNSLPGEAITKNLALLRPWGRFLELGRKDVLEDTPIGMRSLQKNLSFFAIDVADMVQAWPDRLGGLLREVMRGIEAGAFRPLPLRSFATAEAEKAFRHMARARHVGKIALATEAGRSSRVRLHADATYLVTGGLGGLGRVVARWLVDRGARRLVLLQRTALPDRSEWDRLGAGDRRAEAISALRELEELGASVLVEPVDVADEGALRSFLESLEGRGWPPIRGVIHSAGVVAYKPLSDVEVSELRQVLRPKVLGGWLLHRLLAAAPLDFFVLFASASGVLSSPLLGSYAAANAFLDALAQRRSVEGRPALSIDWGFWADVGMAAEQQRQTGRDISPRGMGSLTAEEGLAALDRVFDHPSPQVVVMPVEWRRWREAYPNAAGAPLLSRLVDAELVDASRTSASNGAATITRDELLAAPPDERLRLLEAYLRAQAANVLGLPASKVDVGAPLNRAGLDSLMAVELKNRTQIDLGVSVPVVRFLEGLSVGDLVTEVHADVVAHAQPAAGDAGVSDPAEPVEGEWEQVAL